MGWVRHCYERRFQARAARNNDACRSVLCHPHAISEANAIGPAFVANIAKIYTILVNGQLDVGENAAGCLGCLGCLASVYMSFGSGLPLAQAKFFCRTYQTQATSQITA